MHVRVSLYDEQEMEPRNTQYLHINPPPPAYLFKKKITGTLDSNLVENA
jgi:hypothetical protein